MNAEDRAKQDSIAVQRKLKQAGVDLPLYKIEMVLEAYDDHMFEVAPKIDEDEMNAFIIDELMLDPDVKESVSQEMLERIDEARFDYFVSIGIITTLEDDEEDDE